MTIDNLKKEKTNLKLIIDYLLFFLAVFRDEKKIAVNSSLSVKSGVTFSFDNRFSSIINSSQKLHSSASSITILNFGTNPALDWAIHAARFTL